MVLLSVVISPDFSQCYIKSTNQDQANITYYLDPELVAQTDEIGAAMSVQMIGGNYYLALTYQFAGKAIPVEEKVSLELLSGYTIELDMYTMQGGNAGGVELTLAVFNLGELEISYLRSSKLKTVHFRTQSGVKYALQVTSNPEVLMRQLKCFGL